MSVRHATISSIVWSMQPISSIVAKATTTDTSLPVILGSSAVPATRSFLCPGLTLSIEEDDYFELVMKTAMKGYYEFMEGKPVTVHIAEIDQPDVPLWAVWALQQYAKEKGKRSLPQEVRQVYQGRSDVREVQSSPPT